MRTRKDMCGWVPGMLLSAGLAVAPVSAADRPVDKAVGNAPDSDGWTTLFNGSDLTGWKANEKTESFKVVDNVIVAHGQPRSHLFYVGDEKPFTNFELKLEVLTKPNSNAGIYFHTKWQESGWPKYGIEVQVNCSHRDPIKTGSLYQIVNLSKATHEDDKWFEVHVRVDGRNVVVKIDGTEVVNYTEPENQPVGKDFTRKLDSGTFCLQAHDNKSIVMFRNIRVKRLP